MDLSLLLLGVGGFISGIVAGFLGIGGGTLLVPFIVTLGYSPVEAVATSSLAIAITATSGSVQNWRTGNLDLKKVLFLGLPSILTAQIGAIWANQIRAYLLLFGFGLLLLINIYLVGLRKSLAARTSASEHHSPQSSKRTTAIIATGGTAGFIAGLFGLGGGIILVPLQILLLQENIKTAVQISLGVIVITAISACTGHALAGNVLFLQGICLGVGGLLGVQISTRFLPRLPDRAVSWLFRIFMGLLAGYTFVQAWSNFIQAA